jgi:hypothetical protein
MQKVILLFVVLFGFLSVDAKIDTETEVFQPCMQIKKACEAAGFQRGKTKEGNLVKDCMQKITNGESVKNVNVSADVVNGCKEKHEK